MDGLKMFVPMVFGLVAGAIAGQARAQDIEQQQFGGGPDEFVVNNILGNLDPYSPEAQQLAHRFGLQFDPDNGEYVSEDGDEGIYDEDVSSAGDPLLERLDDPETLEDDEMNGQEEGGYMLFDPEMLARIRYSRY